MNEMEKDYQELITSQLQIAREAFEEKNARMRELEAEVGYLRRLLNELTAAPRLQPARFAASSVPIPSNRPAPLRWKA